MTGPAITAPAPVASVVAPVVTEPIAPVTAPVAPEAKQEPASMESMIASIARKATVGDDAFAVQNPDAPVVTPLIDGAQPVDPAAPTDGTPPVMVAEITADEPEGQVVLRARDPVTGQFSDMDQTRTYELSIRDKQTGETKVYNKTLPDLMRMAKDGISMQRSRDELTYYREQTPQWQTQHATMQQENEGLRALAIELLTAPEEHVVTRREAYAAEQSPEKQLARLKAEMAQQEQRRLRASQQQQQTFQQQQIQQHGAALASRLGPVVAEVEGLVGREAAAGKIALETAALMGPDGRIPPERFPQLEAYVTGPYRQWAQAEAAKRTTAQTDIERQRQTTLETQRNAQLAAQRAGAATRPTGGMAGAVAAPQGKPRNVSDAIDRIIRRPVAASA